MPNKGIYNEQQLLLRVAEGDEQAFNELFYTYHNKLGDHIFRLIEDREMTQDIVQEVFVKIWMIRESLVEVSHFRTWLYTISRNRALNALRQVARQRISPNQLKDTIPAEEEIKPYEPALLDLVDQAVAALPPQQQKVYLMSRHQGKRYSDIALELGLSQETVKYYMKLALSSITRTIKQQAGLLALLVLICRI